MDTRKAHTMSCHHLWDSLAPSVHTLLCNPAGPGQFCAIPSECLALATSATERVYTPHIICSRSLPVNLSCHCWKPCTLSACFHGITHTSYTSTNWQWIFTDATHITHKNQNTLQTSKSAMVPADYPSLIWHTYGIHSQLYEYNDTIYMCWLHA